MWSNSTSCTVKSPGNSSPDCAMSSCPRRQNTAGLANTTMCSCGVTSYIHSTYIHTYLRTNVIKVVSNGLTPSRLQIVISFLTHADHIFLGLPRSLVPGSSNRVMELMHEVARCTCPYHLRCRVRRTAVISSRSSFWWSTAVGILSASFAPQIHLIMYGNVTKLQDRRAMRCKCNKSTFTLHYITLHRAMSDKR